MFDHVYAGGSSLLDEERKQMAGYLASFETEALSDSTSGAVNH
jgi:hypothetical protein